MPMIEVNGCRLNVMQLGYKGDGAASELVMVHGLAANMAFWLQNYGQRFSERFRVTLYDLRGHGRSSMTECGYTPQDMADDLAGLLDALEIEKPHVVAHSFGGVATLALACREPERFSSIVINDTQMGLGRAKVRDANWKAKGEIQAALKACGLQLDTNDPYFGYRLITEVARIQAAGGEVPEALYPWVKWMLSANNRKVSERWLQLMEETNAEQELMQDDGITEDRLRRLAAPVLAMYGERSQAMASGELLQQALPQAEFVRVDNGGHFFAKAEPEMVASRCETFWDKINFHHVIPAKAGIQN